MKLDDSNLISALPFLEPGLGKYGVSACLSHSEPYYLHGTLILECTGKVGHKSVSYDLDSLVLEFVGVNKVFGGDNTASSSILDNMWLFC